MKKLKKNEKEQIQKMTILEKNCKKQFEKIQKIKN